MDQLGSGAGVGCAGARQPTGTAGEGEEGQSSGRTPGQRAPPGPMRRGGRYAFANGGDQSFGLCQACIVQVPTFLVRLELLLFGPSTFNLEDFPGRRRCTTAAIECGGC